MHIFRWLMKHPIIILAVYFLCMAAILFSMTRGGSSDKSPELAETVKSETTDVDVTDEPAIEPSTLTSALVNGEPAKEVTAETEQTSTTEGEKSGENTESKATETAASTDTNENKESEEETIATETKTEKPSESTETAANSVESEEGSAASYFKAHGVDPSLNTPVTIASVTEEKQEQTTSEAADNQEEKASTSESTEADTAAVVENDTQFSEMSADEMLLMAREAYWNNGLEESAQIYQQLISANPDAIDYKGELGNVYWRQGFPKKAAELYAEISLPMIEQGNQDRVANMVGFIGLFYPEKATEIHNKLQAGK